MKKIIATILLFFTMFFINACLSPDDYHFSYQDLINNTQSVELIYYDELETYDINRYIDVFLVFDDSKVINTYPLDQDDLGAFILDLSQIDFFVFDTASSGASDYTIKINFKNQDFVLISGILKNNNQYNLIARFDQDGRIKEYLASAVNLADYQMIIDKYWELTN